MTNLIALTLLGFVLGMRHATDADHVIAVSTIVSRQRSVTDAALIGAIWGFGHTLTIMTVGAGIIVFNLVIPPRLGLAMELAVGIMLVLLGALNLSGLTRRLTLRFTAAGASGHSHLHGHGDGVHDHFHTHGLGGHSHAQRATHTEWLHRRFKRTADTLGSWQMLRPLLIGVVHGLAGSAALALLVLATVHNSAWSVAYLLVFGGGTVAGMMLITAAIAVPFARTRWRFTRFGGSLTAASGLLSLGFGLFIAYQTGFASGLFTGHPHWTPH